MSERGWPSFMDSIDQWTQKAKEGSSTTAPPPERQPDPTGPSPAGEQPWANQTPAAPHQATASAWAIAGGTAIFLGSLLPFFFSSDAEFVMNPSARATSALFGLIVLGLGIALRAVPRHLLIGTSVAALCLSGLGALGYAITIVAGLAGITEQDPFGFPVKVTFSPGIGILLALAGCAAACAAGVKSLQHYRS